MAASLLLFIVVGIFVLFIVPELRRAILSKGTLLLLAFMIVALLSFASGLLASHLNKDTTYRVDPRLMTAIRFLDTYQESNERLPSREEFDQWESENGDKWYSYEHLVGSNQYMIRAWNGDEYQVYDSETSVFSFSK